VQLLGATPIEPLAAHHGNARCATDSTGVVSVGSGLPVGLSADAAFAETTATPAAAPGAAAALRIEGVTASASAACANGVAQLSGDSTVARIALGPVELPVDQVVERVGTGLDGLPLDALLRIVPGEELRTGSGANGTLTRRALHVTVALGGNQLVDAVVGEATAGTADAACTATGGDGGGGGGNGTLGIRPIAGTAFGGGMAVTLGQLGALGISAGHPCRNRRYGGDVAVVGTSGRDTLAQGPAARRRQQRPREGRRRPRRRQGDAGADRLLGNAGNDRIVTGAGRDRAWGGPGDDTIDARAKGGRQRIDCGAGRDTVRLSKGDVARRCERVIRRR
jgi:hypothetical protein